MAATLLEGGRADNDEEGDDAHDLEEDGVNECIVSFPVTPHCVPYRPYNVLSHLEFALNPKP